jgi:dihydrofolate reductase
MGVTLDGYVARPGDEGDWGLAAEHPDVRAWKVASLRKAGTHIMGRVTYEQMARHWPNAAGDYAFLEAAVGVLDGIVHNADESPGPGNCRGAASAAVDVLRGR